MSAVGMRSHERLSILLHLVLRWLKVLHLFLVRHLGTAIVDAHLTYLIVPSRWIVEVRALPDLRVLPTLVHDVNILEQRLVGGLGTRLELLLPFRILHKVLHFWLSFGIANFALAVAT